MPHPEFQLWNLAVVIPGLVAFPWLSRLNKNSGVSSAGKAQTLALIGFAFIELSVLLAVFVVSSQIALIAAFAVFYVSWPILYIKYARLMR